MSVALWFTEKCLQLMDDNANMIVQLWNNPSKLVTGGVTGGLVDAAKGGMAGLEKFAEDYIANNAESLIVGALGATGLEKQINDAYQFVNNAIAAMFMANNDFILQMVKEAAHEGMQAIHEKDQILIELADKMKQMYVALASLVSTPAEWDAYYSDLRRALALVVQARADLKLVRNSLAATKWSWLGKRFEGSLAKLEQAKAILTPQETNPAVKKINEGSLAINKALGTPSPDKTSSSSNRTAQNKARGTMISNGLKQMRGGLALFGAGLSDNFPFPTTAQQRQGQIAVARLSKQVVAGLQGYIEATIKVNTFVMGFSAAVDALTEGVPEFLKTYVLFLLDRNYQRVDKLAKSMSWHINGAEEALVPVVVTQPRYPGEDPPKGASGPFKPNSLNITTQNYKWIMDLGVIFQAYKTIPAKQLQALQLNQDVVNAYRSSVAQLHAMDGMRSGSAVLKMTDAQESVGDLESQILAFVLEANNAIISGSVRKTILSLARTTLSRLELGLVADHQIYNILETFYLTPLPLQDTLDDMYNGMTKMLDEGGSDYMKKLLKNADFKGFLNARGQNTRYIGRALAALALLQKCNAKKFSLEWWKMDELNATLRSESDLLNISFSINFDLAIMRNVLECIKLRDFGKWFDLEEFICGITEDPKQAGAELTSFTQKLKDVLNIGEGEVAGTAGTAGMAGTAAMPA